MSAPESQPPSPTRGTSLSQCPLAIGISAGSGELRVELHGELDLATAPQFAACLGDLDPSTASLCIDLTRVSFLDLAGLRVLLEAQRDARARGEQLRVVTGDAARRLFEVTHTAHLLEVD